MEAQRTIETQSGTIAASPPPLSLQTRMVVLTYFAYFFYYFARKHLSVATGSLVEAGYSVELIGTVNTAYAGCYMFGQFLSGALGDRKGPRLALFAGMCLSGISTAAFGLFPLTAVLAIGYSLNGLFQSTGWPNTCKVVTAWVSDAKRGRVMGFWLTCYIVGSMAATFFAALVLDRYGWREVFLVMGGVVILIGIIQGLFLINRPEDRGYSFGAEKEERDEVSSPVPFALGGFRKMFTNPAVLLLGLSYFGLKYTRYTLFAWLPFYLEKGVRLPKFASAMASNGFEIGGVLGLVIGGIFADRLFPKNRCRLALLSLVGMIAAVFVYRALSHGVSGSVEILGQPMDLLLLRNVVGVGGIGFFLYIADSIISGTAAQDIGGADHAASACGIINGIGSMGQILAGIVPVMMARQWGWDSVFISFIVFGIISSLIVLPLALRREVGHVP